MGRDRLTPRTVEVASPEGSVKKMTVREARQLAEELGYRLEKVEGEDQWIVRDLYSDTAVVRAAYGMTFAETVGWLERAQRAL